MKCPFCNADFRQSNINGKIIDICKGCNGIWFDQNDLQHYVDFLQKKNQFHKLSSKSDGNIVKVNELEEPHLFCPRCGEVLNKINYLYNSNIIIDRCNKCGGVWADSGESEKIAARLQKENQYDLVGKNLVESIEKDFKREYGKQKRIVAYRFLSGVICLFCLIYSALSAEAVNTYFLFSSLIFPLAFIWFGDEFGSLTGIRFVFLHGPVITKESPGSLIRFLGWIFLFMILWRYLFRSVV